MDEPGKVADPARGQLNMENNIPLSPRVPENLISRDGCSRPVPRQPAHLHTHGGRFGFGSSVKYFSKFLAFFCGWRQDRFSFPPTSYRVRECNWLLFQIQRILRSIHLVSFRLYGS